MKLDLKTTKISLYLFLSSILIGIISVLYGANSILGFIGALSIISIWLVAQKYIVMCNQSTKIFICTIWFLLFSAVYCYFFSEIRLARSTSLFLYPDGDEVNFLNAVKNGSTDIIYSGFDVSILYQAFIWLIKIITLDGNYLYNFYFFNICCLFFGHILLSLAIQKTSNLDIGFSSFLFLSVIPEGYFWALTLYKELLIYLMVTLCLYLYATGKFSKYLYTLALIGFFRPIFVGLASLEFFTNNKKMKLLGKVSGFLFFALIFLFVFEIASAYLSVFFNSERLDFIFKKYGLDWIIDSGLLYFLIPVLAILALFSLFIFIAFQPSAFFINTNLENVYLLPWSDLVFNAHLSLPILSIYIYNSSRSFFKSFSKDIFYRISFLYSMFLSVSFLFLTLRHRFIIGYITIAGSLIMLGKIKSHSIKVSNFNYIICFFFGIACSFLVGQIKA